MAGVFLVFVGLGLGGMVPAAIYWDKEDFQAVARALLIPAILLATIASIGWCGLSFYLLHKSRTEAFRALYTQRWWNVQRAVAANMPAGHGVTAAMRAVRNDMA